MQKQNRNYQYLKLLIVLTMGFAFAGCTATMGAPTQRQIVTSMYQVYNAQYADYLSMAANPNTTEAQKVIMREKKPILEKLGTLIPAYDAAVTNGTASPEMQKTIMDLLNSLNSM